jgi:hypothetical protein
MVVFKARGVVGQGRGVTEMDIPQPREKIYHPAETTTSRAEDTRTLRPRVRCDG